jgi:hypothetical protein
LAHGEGNDYENDEVCGGVYGGQGYPYQGEFGLGVALCTQQLEPHQRLCRCQAQLPRFQLALRLPDDGIRNGLSGVERLRHSFLLGELCRLFWCWTWLQRRRTGDAHIGVEVPVSLAAGGSATVTFIHTYGSGQPATCNLADVNLDGTVDDADLLAVLFAFGNSAPNADVDVNLDGAVDDADLLEVLFNFGSSC